MRPELLLAIALVAGASVLAGCIEGGESLDPQSGVDAEPNPDEDATSTEDASGDEDDGSSAADTTDETNGTAEEQSGEGEASESDGTDENASADGDEAVQAEPTAVIAHVDTGINPYHEVFREDSKLAYTHPSEYVDGFPEDAEALNLTLDAESWQEAFEADRDVWENVTEGDLYWVPGTRIVGAISFGAGGAYCPQAAEAPPAPTAEAILLGIVEDETGEQMREGCEEHPILDDHGHGTMTASRMAGEGTSLCPDCRIVSIEGLGSAQTAWAAEQGWIDVQTNSWGSLYPDPVNDALFDDFGDDIETAAETHLTYFASGNGFAGFFGFTPWPTHVQPTLRENVVWVGAHDNGRVAHWQGTPPHLVADGYRGIAAAPDALEGVEATPFACCTSAASPYAAGLGARVLMEARALLDDASVGPSEGVLASGPAGAVADGPLADGELTLDELRQLVKDTAEPRPTEGRHDGAVHWLGEADQDEATEQSDPWGAAGNPYCPGCITLPYEWTDLPNDTPAYPIVGYGGATPAALQTALAVTEGLAAQPDRGDVDEYFATQEPVRETVHDPAP